jgi:hypothetical protein
MVRPARLLKGCGWTMDTLDIKAAISLWMQVAPRVVIGAAVCALAAKYL